MEKFFDRFNKIEKNPNPSPWIRIEDFEIENPGFRAYMKEGIDLDNGDYTCIIISSDTMTTIDIEFLGIHEVEVPEFAKAFRLNLTLSNNPEDNRASFEYHSLTEGNKAKTMVGTFDSDGKIELQVQTSLRRTLLEEKLHLGPDMLQLLQEVAWMTDASSTLDYEKTFNAIFQFLPTGPDRKLSDYEVLMRFHQPSLN